MESDAVIREQLLTLLREGNAHMPLESAVRDFPEDAMNTCPPRVSYTPWHLLEHIRRAQNDILEFIRDPRYVSPPWPEGYWPATDAKATRAQWQETLRGFRSDLADLQAMVADPAVRLTDPLPHAPGYNIFREILLVADHNAYHVGEFAILRQVMGTWPDNHAE